jgi:hypothetical protein
MLTLTTILTLGAAALALGAFGLALQGRGGPPPSKSRLLHRRHPRA